MVDTIDIAVHGTSLPSGYGGSGTVAGDPRFSPDARHLTLGFSGSGAQANIPLGVEPLRVRVINTTDVIQWEWHRGMAATNTLKTVAAGTVTLDSGSAIVVSGDAKNGNMTVALSATLAASAKALLVFIDF